MKMEDNHGRIKDLSVVKTERVTCRTVEVYGTLYTSEESAKARALEMYRMDKEQGKYDYRVETYVLKN